MKFLCPFFVSISFLGFALTGCERHEFEETKGLHMEHGKGHGDAHATDESHGKDAHAAGDGHGKTEAEAKAAKTEEPRATGL